MTVKHLGCHGNVNLESSIVFVFSIGRSYYYIVYLKYVKIIKMPLC